MTPAARIRPVAAGLPSILLGLMALGVGRLIMIRAEATRSWPSVPGKIIGSSHGVDQVESSGEQGRRATTYYPVWEYEYVVDG